MQGDSAWPARVPDARPLQGVAQENQDLEDVDAHEWRKAALSLGVGGLIEHDQWLEPIVRSVTSGRHGELVDRYETLKCKTEDKGRLVHLMPDGPTPVLASYEKELIRDSVEHKKLEQVLVKCGEFECVQLYGDSSVPFVRRPRDECVVHG